jgi:hypothetical protein
MAVFNGMLKAIENGTAKLKIKEVVQFIVLSLGKIQWKQSHGITDEDKAAVDKNLKDNYCVILIRRGNHLSTYAISFANFVLTRKFSFWSHSLMNLEDEVTDKSDYRLIEAVGRGTKYSSFDDVFGTVDAVTLLKPKGLSLSEWNNIMGKLKSQIGKPYDTLFDLKNDTAVSCVELVRNALRTVPDYETKFAAFEAMINKNKNLTPQMYAECSDFEVIYSVKR